MTHGLDPERVILPYSYSELAVADAGTVAVWKQFGLHEAGMTLQLFDAVFTLIAN